MIIAGKSNGYVYVKERLSNEYRYSLYLEHILILRRGSSVSGRKSASNRGAILDVLQDN